LKVASVIAIAAGHDPAVILAGCATNGKKSSKNRNYRRRLSLAQRAV
jgi:hypothetical protein